MPLYQFDPQPASQTHPSFCPYSILLLSVFGLSNRFEKTKIPVYTFPHYSFFDLVRGY